MEFITLCLIVVLMLTLYILYCYFMLYNSIIILQKNSNELASYSKKYLKKLFIKAINVLKLNANTVAHPYFYNQPINFILNVFPQYIEVLKLCRYIVINPDTNNDLNDILIELYGDRFEMSFNLNILVKVNTSDYGGDEYFSYLLKDIEKSIILYLHNRDYIDKLLYI